MRAHLRKSAGLVLRRYDFRETSLIVILFTEKYGKIRALVKGIKRDPRRFGSRLDLFTLNELVFYARPHRDFDLVGQAALLDHFGGLSEDVGRFGAAGYVTELTHAATVEHDPDPALFQLLVSTLQGLEGAQEQFWLMRFFELRLLKQGGVLPSWACCAKCRKTLSSPYAVFRFSERAFLCSGCSGTAREGLVLHPGALEALSQLSAQPSADSQDAAAETPEVRRELSAWLRLLVDYHIGQRFRPLEFLRKCAHVAEARHPSVSGAGVL
ncbi:MAG: DNA repair protein RecO [Candidatus Omnitrophica bacterium]|nr:DNA repair protein RecO [Candidatus Omnitrophota bacterium]